MRTLILTAALITAPLLSTAPAHADEPGCTRIPLFGLNPQVMSICDGPVNPDGSWQRARKYSHPEFAHSTCSGYEVHTNAGFFCPDWAPRDTIPAYQSGIETYTVTPDTIPPGEPGHLD